MPTKVYSTQEGYDFACLVSGFADRVKWTSKIHESRADQSQPDNAKDSANAKDAVKQNDSAKAEGGLNYDRFEKLAKEIEKEEYRAIPEQERLMAKLKNRAHDAGDVKTNDPLEALNSISKDMILSDDEEGDDTSRYLLNPNPMLMGCAHDRSKERALYNRPTNEKLKMALRFRMEGNEAFQNKDFNKAVSNYQRALLYYEYIFPENDEQEEDFHTNKLSAHLNMAAALFNLKSNRACIAQCQQAIKMKKDCAKAYYRMGQAHLALDEFSEAEKAFEESEKLAVGSGRKALEEIAKRRAVYDKKQQPELFKRMGRGFATG